MKFGPFLEKVGQSMVFDYIGNNYNNWYTFLFSNEMKIKTNTILIFILLALFGSVIAAYIIQYGLGYKPCKLCIYQRIPYIISIIIILNFYLLISIGKHLFLSYHLFLCSALR